MKFSKKQITTLNWWLNPEYKDYDAIICDGAVRSGKTLSMTLGFMFWANTVYRDSAFAICGKTIASLKRNVITPYVKMLQEYGFICEEKVSRNYIDVTFGGKATDFTYLAEKTKERRR